MEKILSSLLHVTLETVITIVLPIVLVRLVSWINTQISATRSQMDKHELELVEILIKQFVRAAEQSGLTGQVKAAGAEKKAFVIALLRQELEERGIELNLETIDAMIEAAVKDAFGKIEVEPMLTDVVG
jgi:LL-H family phage holin